jgi:dolichol kinase
MLAGLLATPFVLYTDPTYASIVALCVVVFIICIELLHYHWGIAVPFWSGQLQSTRREFERFSWASIGFLLTLSLLLWLTPIPVALAAAGMLAFGDGFSALVGRALGRHKIWYNPRKSWEGSVAGVVMGFLGAYAFIQWYAAESGSGYAAVQMLTICGVGAFCAMIGESLPRLQDNVVVPVFAAVPMTILWMWYGLDPAWGLFPARWFGA